MVPPRPVASSDRALQGPVAAAVLRQGLPLALGMASHAVFNLVDLVLVGRLGADAVAGVHVATTINFLPMIVGNGLSVASMAMMSGALGAGQVDYAKEVSARCQVRMLLIGVVVGVVGALLAVPSVDLQGVEGDARDIGIHYLIIANLGTVTMFGLMQTTASMRAVGETAMPFALLIGSNALNLALDVVLLFGWDALSIPAFGAPGAAYATVISRALAAAVGVWWLRRPRHPLRWTGLARPGPEGELRFIMGLGLPASLQMMVRAGVVIGLTRIAADLGGLDTVAALSVTTRLDTMVLFAAVGFGSAATTVAGFEHGAGRLERARSACRWAGVGALALGAALVALFAWFARPLLSLFIEDPPAGVLDAGVLYFSIGAWAQPLASYCIAVAGGVNGTGRVVPPVVLDLVGYLGLLLPAVIIAATWSGSGLAPVWWIFVAANLVLAAAYAVYLERARWAPSPMSE